MFENLDKLRNDPPNSAFDTVPNMKLRSLLRQLKDSRIGEVRNQVVHKHFYRPTLDEVDGFIEEARNILIMLM
ncbi:MAG: hypothetical protein KAT29_09615, partial [Anaerolineales bacterium]|nr:hypothetical protein [Anaerolineales bacterium]